MYFLFFLHTFLYWGSMHTADIEPCQDYLPGYVACGRSTAWCWFSSPVPCKSWLTPWSLVIATPTSTIWVCLKTGYLKIHRFIMNWIIFQLTGMPSQIKHGWKISHWVWWFHLNAHLVQYFPIIPWFFLSRGSSSFFAPPVPSSVSVVVHRAQHIQHGAKQGSWARRKTAIPSRSRSFQEQVAVVLQVTWKISMFNSYIIELNHPFSKAMLVLLDSLAGLPNNDNLLLKW